MSADRKEVSYYMGLPYGERVTREFLEDGSPYFVARVVELEGCTSHGDTAEEARRNLQDAKHLYIRTMIEDGITPPVPETRGVRATWFPGSVGLTVTSPTYGVPKHELPLRIAAEEGRFASRAVSPAKWSVQPL